MSEESNEIRAALCQSLLSLRQGLESGRYNAYSIKWINEVYLTGIFLFYAFDIEGENKSLVQLVTRYCTHVDAAFGSSGFGDVGKVFEPLRLIPVGSEDVSWGERDVIRQIQTEAKSLVLKRLRENIFKASLIDPEKTGDTQEEKNYIVGMAEVTAMRIGDLFNTPCGVGAIELLENANYIKVALEFVCEFEECFKQAEQMMAA